MSLERWLIERCGFWTPDQAREKYDEAKGRHQCCQPDVSSAGSAPAHALLRIPANAISRSG